MGERGLAKMWQKLWNGWTCTSCTRYQLTTWNTILFRWHYFDPKMMSHCCLKLCSTHLRIRRDSTPLRRGRPRGGSRSRRGCSAACSAARSSSPHRQPKKELWHVDHTNHLTQFTYSRVSVTIHETYSKMWLRILLFKFYKTFLHVTGVPYLRAKIA